MSNHPIVTRWSCMLIGIISTVGVQIPSMFGALIVLFPTLLSSLQPLLDACDRFIGIQPATAFWSRHMCGLRSGCCGGEGTGLRTVSVN